MEIVTIRLPLDILQFLDEVAKLLDTTRSSIIRGAIEDVICRYFDIIPGAKTRYTRLYFLCRMRSGAKL